MALDAAREKGLLKDIPVFGWVAKLYIDRVPITDLRRLPSYKQRLDSYDGKSGESFVNVLKDDTCQSLYTSGLISSDSVFEVTYHSNEVMAVLVELVSRSYRGHITKGSGRMLRTP